MLMDVATCKYVCQRTNIRNHFSNTQYVPSANFLIIDFTIMAKSRDIINQFMDPGTFVFMAPSFTKQNIQGFGVFFTTASV